MFKCSYVTNIKKCFIDGISQKKLSSQGLNCGIEFLPNSNLLPIGSLHKYFFKIETNPRTWLIRPELYHKTTKAGEPKGC